MVTAQTYEWYRAYLFVVAERTITVDGQRKPWREQQNTISSPPTQAKKQDT